MIHIGRAGARLGSFSEEEVRRGLANGRFFPQDLGWKEGMANWARLSQFDEFAAPPPPLPEAAVLAPEEGAEASQPAGLPWDDWKQRGFLVGFGQTVRLVLVNPSEAFARMLVTGGLSSPLLYNLIGGWLGMVAVGIYAVLTTGAQPPPGNLTNMQRLFYPTPGMAMSAMKLFIFMGPVIVTVSALISSGLAHLFLMLAGGANKPFHVTLRVFCFSYGSTQLLEMLPFCGGLLAMVWLLVCCTVGLAIAHGTTTGRAVTAMALFVAACFVCCLGIFFLAAAASYDSMRPMLNP